MIIALEEVTRSLTGAWDLLNHRAQGLRRFQFDEQAFWRSFCAPLLAAPALVIWLAADRAAHGLLRPGVSLFSDPWLIVRAGTDFVALWLTLPMLAFVFARQLRLQATLVSFIIVCNWMSVLAAAILAVPALLFIIGWATSGLTLLFVIAAGVVVMQMRWYAAHVTLGVTGGVAMLLVSGDALVGIGLLRLLI